MEENKQNIANTYEDEISLKELIETILKGWKFIVGVTILCTLIAVVYVLFIAEEVYEAKAELLINIPESVQTEYGEYKYMTTNVKDYSDLFKNKLVLEETKNQFGLDDVTVEGFAGRFNVLKKEKGEESNIVKVTFKGSEKNSLAEILDAHIVNYKKLLNYNIRKLAIDKFINSKNIAIENNKKNLEFNRNDLKNTEELLKDIPETLKLQKALTDDSEISSKYANKKDIDVSDLADNMVVEEVLNSDYVSTASKINDLKISINTLREEIVLYEGDIKKLEEANEIISLSGVFGDYEIKSLEILDTPIEQLTPARTSDNIVSPKRNIIIAVVFILSVMLSTFMVLFKAYWVNN